MAKKSKKFFLSPAVIRLKITGGKEAVEAFKLDVCKVLGWTSLKSWYKIQSVGIVDIGVTQYEGICEVMRKYGITPEQGWGIKEV